MDKETRGVINDVLTFFVIAGLVLFAYAKC